MKITMLLSNAFRPDPRVAKEAAGLTAAGHEVTIIAWDRLGSFPAQETRAGYRIERIKNVQTVYGAGPSQLLHTLRFWIEAIRRLHSSQPDAIHCHDLDTLPVGWWMKRLCEVKLVYDAHENYPAQMSLYLPSIMVIALSKLEHYLIKNVDATITASSVFADYLFQLEVQNVITIGNYPQLETFKPISSKTLLQARENLNLEKDDLVIAYIGGFSRNRLILPLIKAAEGMHNVQVLIWGDGDQRKAIETLADQISNVHYLGWLPEQHVPLYTYMADVIYYCLLPEYAGAIYNAPNTLSNTMASGRPIIANDIGDLGRIIRKTGCGLLLSRVNPDTIRQAINSLRNEEFRQVLGSAGRQAAELEYNWGNALEDLIDIYS